MWTYYLVLNIITFCLYGYDKFIAGRDYSRIPEFVLHLLTVFGGIPGAWLGMFIFRHKVRSN